MLSRLCNDPKGSLFRTTGLTMGALITTPPAKPNALAMIHRRAAQADFETFVGNHTFRATGIIAYLKNGGTSERFAFMVKDASTRTTQLFDPRDYEISLEKIERVKI